MLDIKVGKKYLDNKGQEWEVTGITANPNGVYCRETARGYSAWVNMTSFTSALTPSPATTTPQEPTKFKVGDRVRVISNDEDYENATGIVDEYSDAGEIGVAFDERQADGSSAAWFYVWELEHLTDTDTPTTPSLVQCSCPTVVLMRDGCKCGCARKEIEQEFKREGWG